MIHSTSLRLLKPASFYFLLISSFVFFLVAPGSLLAANELEEADFFIAVSGKDSNPGTRQKPFATFPRAFQAVQERVKDGLTKNLIVEIHPGLYETKQGFHLGPETGGNKKYSVTFKTSDKNKVIVSGGQNITGWKKEENGTWSASLGKKEGANEEILEFYVSGQRRPRARFPNEGYLKVEKPGADNRTSFSFNDGDITEFPLGSQAEMLFLHDWSSSRVGIKSIDFKKRELVFKTGIGFGQIDRFEKHPRYCLENDIAFLDSPGEWFHDATKGRIYYKPLPEELITNFTGLFPLAKSLMVIEGTDKKKVQNLRFEGIQFSYCAWKIPQGGYAGIQAGFHEKRDGSVSEKVRGVLPAAITVKNSDDCIFDSCTFSHLGGSGIWLENRCNNCVLSNSVITDIAGNGVLVGENRSRNVNGKPWWQNFPEQASRGNQIHNNLIENCGVLYRGCLGVWVGMTDGTRITHNEIRNLPYTGVSVGWIWSPTPSPCRGNIVSENHIHHVMQELSDGGGIYTLGRQPGTKLVRNWIHDIPLNLGRAESNGMFLDEGTTGILIKGNVINNIDRSPLRFHRAGENNVDQNFLAVKENIPIVRYNSTPEKNVHLKRNDSLPHQSWLKKDFSSFPEKYRPIIKKAGRINVEDEKYKRNVIIK